MPPGWLSPTAHWGLHLLSWILDFCRHPRNVLIHCPRGSCWLVSSQHETLVVEYGVYFDELINYIADLVSLNIKWNFSLNIKCKSMVEKIVQNSTTETRGNEFMYNSNSLARSNSSILILWIFLNQNQVLMLDFFFFQPIFCCCWRYEQ